VSLPSRQDVVTAAVGFIAATRALDHDGTKMASNLDRYKKDLDSLITQG
jgi:hypothetical protein